MSRSLHESTVQFLTLSPHNLPPPTTHRTTRPHDTYPPSPPLNLIRLVCVSDTHSHPAWHEDLPDGDILIHAGDLTLSGSAAQLRQVYKEIKALPHAIKLVIAGNHDLGLDPHFVAKHGEELDSHGADVSRCVDEVSGMWKSQDAKDAGIVFLDHESTEVTVRGRRFKVFGSPWTPEFFDWAFTYPLDKDIWNPPSTDASSTRPGSDSESSTEWDVGRGPANREGVPEDTEILITHGPPRGTLDSVASIGSVGCPFLSRRVRQVKPRVHVFGHIHEGASIGLEVSEEEEEAGGSGGRRTMRSVNAAVLDEGYRLTYAATVIDL